jgi:type II secretory pathway pseudopilin PulG
MKTPSKVAGMTLVETLVVTAVIGVVGAILVSLLHGVFVLSAKNSAINFSHQQMREMIHKTVNEIRGSASVPQLIDANRTPLSGTDAQGPAAGVAYQTLTGGPYRVWNNTQANNSSIRITNKPGDPIPEAGMRLIIPAFQIEADIVDVGGLPGFPHVRNIKLATNVGVDITCNAGEPVYRAYYTRRSGLVVADGELRHFANLAKPDYSVTARNLATEKPFTVPAGDNRFIRMDLVARDPKISRRGYKAVDVKLTLTVPFRNALTTRQ